MRLRLINRSIAFSIRWFFVYSFVSIIIVDWILFVFWIVKFIFFELIKMIFIVFIENLMSRIMFDMSLLFKLKAKIARDFREKTRFSLNIFYYYLTSSNFRSIWKLSTLKINDFDLMFCYCLCCLSRVVNENFCSFFLSRFLIFNCDCNEFSNVDFFFLLLLSLNFVLIAIWFCFWFDEKIR